MRLSEAVRLGAMLRPQAFGTRATWVRRGFLGLFGSPEKSATCALGAAFEAGGCEMGPRNGGLSVSSRDEEVTAGEALIIPYDWFYFISLTVECPECVRRGFGGRIVAHLNDDHRWSRERIADWIATFETNGDSECVAHVDIEQTTAQ